jgi:hypothetical protein
MHLLLGHSVKWFWTEAWTEQNFCNVFMLRNRSIARYSAERLIRVFCSIKRQLEPKSKLFRRLQSTALIPRTRLYRKPRGIVS